MKRLALFICILFAGRETAVLGQSAHILLDSFANDEKAKKMQALIAVYRYSGQPFQDPVLNGLETKEKPNTFNAKLPDLKGAKDTAYAYLYFGGIADNKVLPGYVFVVITNNTRNSKPCLLWIDRNYNLDLTDDGAPDSFYYNTKFKDIQFTNPAEKDGFYTVRISRFPFSYNMKYLSMLDEYYKENSGTKIFSGSFFSFREERLNVKAGDYKYVNDSFRIALKDVNCDGIYNEPGVDVIVLGDYKTHILSNVKVPIANRQGKTYFEKNGKHYDIERIDKSGGFMDIRLDTKAAIKNSLVVGKKISKFKFISTEKDKKNIPIRKFRKKPTYIFVWRFGENNFDNDTAALREIALKYGDKINLVTLNYGETPKELKLFKRRNRINWLIGFSSATINQKLFIENYPTGILTNKRLRIRQIGISPVELLNLLTNNSL